MKRSNKSTRAFLARADEPVQSGAWKYEHQRLYWNSLLAASWYEGVVTFEATALAIGYCGKALEGLKEGLIQEGVQVSIRGPTASPWTTAAAGQVLLDTKLEFLPVEVHLGQRKE